MKLHLLHIWTQLLIEINKRTQPCTVCITYTPVNWERRSYLPGTAPTHNQLIHHAIFAIPKLTFKLAKVSHLMKTNQCFLIFLNNTCIGSMLTAKVVNSVWRIMHQQSASSSYTHLRKTRFSTIVLENPLFKSINASVTL